MRIFDQTWLVWVVIGCGAGSSVVSGASAAEPVPGTYSVGADDPPPGLQLEDVPELLLPATPPTAADQERVEALALFAAGRMKEHQGDDAAALKYYQRALRHDPQSLAILRQIVPLALKLSRTEEFLRYAVMIAEMDPSNAALLRQLADHLASQGNFAEAIALYEQELARRRDEKKSGNWVVLLNQVGRLYFLEGQFDKAAESFAKVVDALEEPNEYGLREPQRKAILTDALRSYRLFAATFLEAGKIDRAEAAYNKAHELSPDEAVHGFHMAQIADRRGEPQAALAHLEKYLSAGQSSEGSQPYELLEKLLAGLERTDELEARLAALNQEDPKNLALGEYLADYYRKAERWDDAQPIYAAILENLDTELFQQSPTVADLRGPKGAAYRVRASGALSGLAEIYRRTENVEKLLVALGRAAAAGAGLEIVAAEAQAVVENASLLDSLIAHARARREAEGDQFDYGPALAAASLALEAGRVQDAGEFFDAAVRAEEELADETLMAWGLGLLMMDKYAEAAEVFQRGIDAGRMPDDPRYHYFLAGALEMAGDTGRALAAAREAANLGSENPRVTSRVAWVLYHAQRYEEALQAYTELINDFDAERSSPEIRDALRDARLVLSNICVIQGDLAQAEEWLEQVLDEFPEDISALNDLGYLWADQNKHLDRALAMVQKAVDAEPDNAAYRDSLGWALYRLGRFDEAVVELEKAAASDDPDGVILDHLGDAYQAAGESAKAVASWQRAVEALKAADDDKQAEATQTKIDAAARRADAETAPK